MPQPHDFYPQNLSVSEIANPYMVANTFFHEYDLAYVKRTIASWMAAVYKAASWNHESPGNLVYFLERLFRLIEAGWLINQMDNSERLANLRLQYPEGEIDMMNPALYCKFVHKDYPWDYFPRNLTRKEFITPYKVFPKFFQFRTLSEWKEELHNILHIALTGDNMEATGDVIDVLAFKKHLDKLADACHLISVREFEWSNGEIIVKTINTINNEGENTTEKN
ncbi:hypothetical protein GO495_05390 [Chitinophaga oryziterrae]|uniref:Uncharacterized protein n=1 Tax=Chitinophaga oryziterrae TaxID=1031224 RepID=A0A6N8J6W1_9BACT|nr:hypothetical protein [Chitinophaga oryziterrae]MVT40006.1 hypothetical protein [Chitinophaga oryziterrae]